MPLGTITRPPASSMVFRDDRLVTTTIHSGKSTARQANDRAIPLPARPAFEGASSQDGLGGAILNFNQYYISSPESLWATNLIAALLGIAFFLAVVLAERLVVRRAPEHVA